MSDVRAKMEGLKADWDSCKSQDDRKHSLISDLFTHIDYLSSELSDAKLELRDKKDVIKLTRDRLEEREMEVKALQIEKARLDFACVVIDGDSMPFKDELVKLGVEGGKRTASLLKQAVQEELTSSTPTAAHHVQVHVRVYANVAGLAKTYNEMDVLSEATFDDFVRGFNMGDRLCDYIDAGNGKECADVKVNAYFQFCLANIHCQRILFGGTTDNGYARLLGPHAEDHAVRGRITLLEGPPFARELADIKDKFRTVPFDNVFRSHKLVNGKRGVSFYTTRPATPPVDYASAAAKVPSTPSPSSAAQRGSSPPSVLAPSGVLRNRRGQRVDPPLRYSQQDFQNLRALQLCNSFHLLGKCYYHDTFGECQHNHKEKLSTVQKAALRAVARQTPCMSGLSCSDPDCLHGHRCPRDLSGCVTSRCRFPPELHDVDATPVR
ncbi:uncharacterized protein B0H64DRAFT_409905 [Chaetomium fimeti]|uniref:C3H1-type domain-containing protein n=1 Tax=Chaetomium fimeti TaxID=1854472 RepID=A0AAE0LMR7_9PEZI|nr:hypothetical protein B0H64DRAFT_409905 [Chaetomium fimeti]